MLFRRTSLEHLQLKEFGYATWKSYANLRKKAVEQEFTWSGFVISLSIAFLFVVSCSSGLDVLYQRAMQPDQGQAGPPQELLLESPPNNYLA